VGQEDACPSSPGHGAITAPSGPAHPTIHIVRAWRYPAGWRTLTSSVPPDRRCIAKLTSHRFDHQVGASSRCAHGLGRQPERRCCATREPIHRFHSPPHVGGPLRWWHLVVVSANVLAAAHYLRAWRRRFAASSPPVPVSVRILDHRWELGQSSRWSPMRPERTPPYAAPCQSKSSSVASSESFPA
jgi:hypothetical protein